MSSAAETPHLLSQLATLSDLARVRILRLLEREELSVGELARAMQLPQSTVSRHLKKLLGGHWISKRSEGTASLYRFSPADPGEAQSDLWALTTKQLGSSVSFDEDEARLNEVLAERKTDSKAFFGRHAGEWDQLRSDLFGEQFTSEALLSLIPHDIVIADLGCGTGNVSEAIAPQVRKVIAVDREQAMIDAAKKRLSGLQNVEFRLGELTAIPIEDSSVNVAIIFLVLHHLPDPALAIRESHRILAPGGMLMIVDMIAHERDSYRHTMGHLHLGFAEKDLKQWSKAAGFKSVRFRRLRPNTASKGPGLFVVTMEG